MGTGIPNEAGTCSQTVYLKATHEKTFLDYVPFDILKMYALDKEEAEAELKSLDDQRAKLEKMVNSDAKEFE